jgi:hypothetical protein
MLQQAALAPSSSKRLHVGYARIQHICTLLGAEWTQRDSGFFCLHLAGERHK